MGNGKGTPIRATAAIALALLAPGLSARAADDPPATVTVRRVKVEAFSDVLSFPARIVPKVVASVLAQADGLVRRVPIRIGQSVERGRELVTLGHTDPIYQYAPLTIRSPISGVVSSVDVSEG